MKCNDVEFRQRRSYYGWKIILWTEMIISARHPADAIVHDCLYFQKVTLSTSFVLGILLSEATLTPLFVFIKGHFYCPIRSLLSVYTSESIHRNKSRLGLGAFTQAARFGVEAACCSRGLAQGDGFLHVSRAPPSLRGSDTRR